MSRWGDGSDNMVVAGKVILILIGCDNSWMYKLDLQTHTHTSVSD